MAEVLDQIVGFCIPVVKVRCIENRTQNLAFGIFQIKLKRVPSGRESIPSFSSNHVPEVQGGR